MQIFVRKVIIMFVVKELPPDELPFPMFLQEHKALFFDHTIFLHLPFIGCMYYLLYKQKTTFPADN